MDDTSSGRELRAWDDAIDFFEALAWDTEGKPEEVWSKQDDPELFVSCFSGLVMTWLSNADDDEVEKFLADARARRPRRVDL